MFYLLDSDFFYESFDGTLAIFIFLLRSIKTLLPLTFSLLIYLILLQLLLLKLAFLGHGVCENLLSNFRRIFSNKREQLEIFKFAFYCYFKPVCKKDINVTCKYKLTDSIKVLQLYQLILFLQYGQSKYFITQPSYSIIPTSLVTIQLFLSFQFFYLIKIDLFITKVMSFLIQLFSFLIISQIFLAIGQPRPSQGKFWISLQSCRKAQFGLFIFLILQQRGTLIVIIHDILWLQINCFTILIHCKIIVFDIIISRAQISVITWHQAIQFYSLFQKQYLLMILAQFSHSFSLQTIKFWLSMVILQTMITTLYQVFPLFHCQISIRQYNKLFFAVLHFEALIYDFLIVLLTHKCINFSISWTQVQIRRQFL